MLDRRRAAILRQQRRMYIDAAMHGNIEHFLREDLAERRYHRYIWCQRAQLEDKGCITCAFRLKHGNIVRSRPRLNRRWDESLPTAARAIGLRNDSSDLRKICTRVNCREHRHREIRRSHEDDTHTRHSFSSSLRRLMAISMKSLPSRWSHSC